MSIVHTFDNTTEAIINPTNFKKKIEGFPETIIVSFSQRMVDVMISNCNHEIIDSVNAGREIPIYKTIYNDKEIGFYATCIGGAATVGLLEEIIALGGKKILLFGSCGSLDREITVGHIIVPTFAYRDEGTSYHYAHTNVGDYIEVKTSERLANILTDIKIAHTCGKTWTTDAIYRETRKNMEKRKADGCLVVEMECASVMAMANFRGIETYQFFYSADSLDGEKWDARILGNMPNDTREQLIRIAFEVAIRL